MIPHVEDLTAAVKALLLAGNTTSNRLDVFTGEVNADMDDDGRAHPYVAVWPAPGQVGRMPHAPVSDSLVWSFQTTCAGGDADRALRALSRTRDRLDGARLTVAGLLLGVLHEQEFTAAGPLREDRDVQPSRRYVVLQWDVLAISNP